MKLVSAYRHIKQLNVPVFRTDEVAISLNISNKYSHKILNLLAREGLIVHLKRGLWGLRDELDPLVIPDYLTAPLPSYISLQSALYHHGLISQIPSVVYAVSLARTRTYETSLGNYSIHHIQPALFSGFDRIGMHSVPMAQPEKALFDFFYFKSAKNKLFYTLPEIEFPKDFDWGKLRHYSEKLINKSRKSMVLNLIQRFSKL